MIKKYVRLVTLVLVLVAMLCLPVLATEPSFSAGVGARPLDNGMCGERIYWELDVEGFMSIYGRGPMYASCATGVWENYREELVQVEIGEEVTTIGSMAFADCPNLTRVTLPVSLESIGADAFSGCSSLTAVGYNGNLTQWKQLLAATGSDVLANATVCFLYQSGWSDEDGKWYYYEAGFPVTDRWLKDSTDWVYLGSDGAMVTNTWVQRDGQWYYAGPSGYCVKNTWQHHPEFGWAYLGADGITVKNRWMTLTDGQWLYLGADGFMATNCWQKDSYGWCWLGNDGYMAYSQWIRYDGNLYYVDGSGYRVSGKQTIDGHTYQFDSDGVLLDVCTISFLYWDGSVYESAKFKLGDTLYIPEPPIRESDGTYTYTFNGWTPEVPAVVTGDATFTATYLATEVDNSVAQGSCGANAQWKLSIDGTLTIFGTGAIGYYDYEESPWYAHREKINTILVENGITQIPFGTFYGCGNLEAITVPFVGSDSKLTGENYPSPFGFIFGSLPYPGSVGTIQYHVNSTPVTTSATYYIPASLTSVTVSVGTDYFMGIGICKFAFTGCNNLTSISLSDSMDYINHRAFQGCINLIRIWVDADNPYYSSDSQGVLYNKSKTRLLYTPGKTTNISIPDSVLLIGERAFSDCTSLTDVYYGGTESQWNSVSIGEFNDCLTNATIHYDNTEPTEPEETAPTKPDPGEPTEPAVPEPTAPEAGNAILYQPEDVSAETGDVVSFHVEVFGDVVSYRWEYRKIYKWFNTSMEGYNTDTLTVPATGARNGYDYRCVITFADGTVLTSEPAELLVETFITEVVGPNDQTVVLGYKGQFTASAQGEGIKYQWQYKRPDGTQWIDTAMEGCTKPTVLIETTAARDGYQYRCRITDVTGNVTVYTEPATMRVLSFKQHPVETFAATGDTVQFTVGANVSGGYTYQWQYRRSAAAAWTNTTLDGYNTATLTVAATKARNGYEYRCILTGSKNSKIESKAATLHVGDPVVISGQPADVTCAVGEIAVFTVEATNAYAYQWQYCRPGSTLWSNTGADGNQTATLNWTAKSSNNGYKLRCVIYGLDGQEYSTEAVTLTVG